MESEAVIWLVCGSALHPAWNTCIFELSFAAVWFFDHLIDVECLISWLLLWGRVWPPIQASTTQSAVRFRFCRIQLVNSTWSCRFGWTLCFLGYSVGNFLHWRVGWAFQFSINLLFFFLNWGFFQAPVLSFFENPGHLVCLHQSLNYRGEIPVGWWSPRLISYLGYITELCWGWCGFLFKGDEADLMKFAVHKTLPMLFVGSFLARNFFFWPLRLVTEPDWFMLLKCH